MKTKNQTTRISFRQIGVTVILGLLLFSCSESGSPRVEPSDPKDDHVAAQSRANSPQPMPSSESSSPRATSTPKAATQQDLFEFEDFRGFRYVVRIRGHSTFVTSAIPPGRVGVTLQFEVENLQQDRGMNVLNPGGLYDESLGFSLGNRGVDASGCPEYERWIGEADIVWCQRLRPTSSYIDGPNELGPSEIGFYEIAVLGGSKWFPETYAEDCSNFAIFVEDHSDRVPAEQRGEDFTTLVQCGNDSLVQLRTADG